MRIIGYRNLILESLPFLICLVEDGLVVVIDVDKVAELIMRCAVESHLFYECIARFVGLTGVESTVVHV